MRHVHGIFQNVVMIPASGLTLIANIGTLALIESIWRETQPLGEMLYIKTSGTEPRPNTNPDSRRYFRFINDRRLTFAFSHWVD